MAKWPKQEDLFDPASTGQLARIHMQEWYDVTRQMTSALAYTELTIAEDKITPSSGALLLNTEGNAPADNLSVIDPTGLQNGALLHLKAAYADRKITLVHGTGLNGIQLAGGKNKVLKHNRPVILRLNGQFWVEDSASPDIANATEEGLAPAGAAPTKILSGSASDPSQAEWKDIAELADGATLKYNPASNKLEVNKASSAEAAAGVDDSKLMTAKKTKEVVEPITSIANQAASVAAAAQATANAGYGLNAVVVQTVDGPSTGAGKYYDTITTLSRSGNVITLTRSPRYFNVAGTSNCVNCANCPNNCDCGRD